MGLRRIERVFFRTVSLSAIAQESAQRLFLDASRGQLGSLCPVPICYNCLAPATTGDHVPPAGFFRSPKPANLITVPCCEACNRSFSMDDEAFRAWVVAPEDISEAGKWIREKRVYERTFKRSPKMVAHMQASMGEMLVDGKPVDVLNFPAHRANRFLTRITKGLLAAYYPDFPRHDQEYQATIVDPTPENLVVLEKVRDNSLYDERGLGVFQFRRAVFPEQGWGCWLYTFYEASLFMIRHRTQARVDG